MDQKFSNLVLTRYLCPYCGKWHTTGNRTLEDYEILGSSDIIAKHSCPNLEHINSCSNYRFYFRNGNFHYSIASICGKAQLNLEGELDVISELSYGLIVTFKVPFTSSNSVGSANCETCAFVSDCACVKLGDRGDGRHMYITLGFEFEDYDCDDDEFEDSSEPVSLPRKEKEQQERKPTVASKKQIPEQKDVTKNKEETTMANDIFNMSMEFGPNKDENIASTLMGIAVKNGNSWRIYDKEKKEITDLGNMELGTFPLFLVPTTKLSEGDLIKDNGEYYYATRIATSRAPAQMLSARTGEMKVVVPIKNILGISCYSKVIALSDSLDIDSGVDMETLIMMSAMNNQPGANGFQMNQLLPLLLFKDKLGGDSGDDKTKNLLLMSSMMNFENGSGETDSGETGVQMNQLLPLLLFKDKLGGDDGDGKTKDLLLMYSMMGGNMGGANNPITTYLMLDAFMGKKDNETPESDDKPSK